MIVHPIPPVFDGTSKILILGSFPSVRSREEGFYYGHPRNRFWRVLAAVLEEKVPKTVDETQAMLLRNGVALWDAAASCEIEGSLDSAMRSAVPNDIAPILRASRIKTVVTNGKKAHEIYEKGIYPRCGIRDVTLPSTSAANAAYSTDELIRVWRGAIAPQDGREGEETC